MGKLVIFILACSGAWAQDQPNPYQKPFSTVMFYDGSNRLEYLCQAYASQRPYQLTVASATNASPGVFTTAAHGMYIANWPYKPKVSISGGTGNWTVANASWVLIPTSTTEFTLVSLAGVPFNTSALGAVTGTLVVVISTPRTNANHWFLRKFSYDASSNNIGVLTGYDSTVGLGMARCDDRATDGLIEWR